MDSLQQTLTGAGKLAETPQGAIVVTFAFVLLLLYLTRSGRPISPKGEGLPQPSSILTQEGDSMEATARAAIRLQTPLFDILHELGPKFDTLAEKLGEHTQAQLSVSKNLEKLAEAALAGHEGVRNTVISEGDRTRAHIDQHLTSVAVILSNMLERIAKLEAHFPEPPPPPPPKKRGRPPKEVGQGGNITELKTKPRKKEAA